MKKFIIGINAALAASVFVLSRGTGVLALAGTLSTLGLFSFLLIAMGLPLGSCLALFGVSGRFPIMATSEPTAKPLGSDTSKNLAIVALIIALILGGTAVALSITAYTTDSTQNYNLSNLSTQFTSLNSSIAEVNSPPTVVGVKIQWCLQSVVQDRFCPGNIVVEQGDIVQVFFLQNDTAAHSFNLDTPPYNLQINDSGQGELNFLNNYSPNAGNCSNSGTFAQMSAGISDAYCVSGTSLLSPSTLSANAANNFRIAQNPNPGLPFTPNNQIVAGEPSGVNLTNPGPTLYPVNYQVEMLSLSVSGVGVNATGGSETQGIAAFRATTPGVFEFFCKYHVSNGMFGYLIVLPNAYCHSNATACGLS